VVFRRLSKLTLRAGKEGKERESKKRKKKKKKKNTDFLYIVSYSFSIQSSKNHKTVFGHQLKVGFWEGRKKEKKRKKRNLIQAMGTGFL